MRLQATLACGLRDESRIKMKMSGAKINMETALFAAAVDHLAFIAWTKTEEAAEGRNRPESIFAILTGGEQEKELQSFGSGEDFERKRREILRR